MTRPAETREKLYRELKVLLAATNESCWNFKKNQLFFSGYFRLKLKVVKLLLTLQLCVCVFLFVLSSASTVTTDGNLESDYLR